MNIMYSGRSQDLLFLCVFILNVGLKRVIMGATISITLN